MSCEREHELLEMLQNGFVGPELSDHADSCGSCNELMMVVGALLDESQVARAEATVPPSGAMLLRIRARERHEAEMAARRSLLIGQGVSLSVGLILLVALFAAPALLQTPGGVTELVRTSWIWLAAIGSFLVFAPIAGAMALSEK